MSANIVDGKLHNVTTHFATKINKTIESKDEAIIGWRVLSRSWKLATKGGMLSKVEEFLRPPQLDFLEKKSYLQRPSLVSSTIRNKPLKSFSKTRRWTSKL